MKKSLSPTLAFLLVFTWYFAKTQCNGQFCPPGQVVPALSAAEACVLCSLAPLDGYLGNTADPPNSQTVPGQFCGSIENNRWFAFIAPLETVTFEFEVMNCQGTPNGGGIQAHVYRSTDCMNSSAFIPVSNCWSPGSPTDGTVTASGLTVGETYYLMIDSWAGDICEYIIHVDDAALAATPGDGTPTFSGPTMSCPGRTEEFTFNGAACFPNYEWSFTGNGTLIIGFNPAIALVEFGDPANGTLCLTTYLPGGSSEQFCQTIEPLDLQAALASTDPAIGTGGSVDLCLGQNLSAEALVPNVGNGLLKYTWSFGNGEFAAGENTEHGYSLPGVYELMLSVSSSDCGLTDTVSQQVRVSPAPEVMVTGIPAGPFCAGEEITLHVDVSQAEMPVEPLLFERQLFQTGLPLPDGTGESLEPEFLILGSDPGSTLTNVDNFEICVNMEHSWMRDLQITLSCSNGQSAILHNHPGQTGGEVFLGEPFENDEGLPEPIPGIGYDYCWAKNAPNPTWIIFANTTGPDVLPSGKYSSFQPLENLIGCPIDGPWTLTFTDLWAIDNGHVFTATIILDNPGPNLLTPTTTTAWQPDPTIVFLGNDDITVAPSEPTTYYLSVTNDLGCAVEMEVPVQAIATNDPACLPCDSLWVEAGEVIVGCDDVLPVVVTGMTSYESDLFEFEWTLNGTVVSGGQQVAISGFGEYIFTATNTATGCSASDTLLFVDNTDLPVANGGPDAELPNCPDPVALVLNGSNSSIGAAFMLEWTDETGASISSTPFANVSTPGIYTLTVTNIANGCSDTDQVLVTEAEAVQLLPISSPDSCGLSIGTATVQLQPAQPGAIFVWEIGSTGPTATGLGYGSYGVSVTWGPCTAELEVTVDSVACLTPTLGQLPGVTEAWLSPNPSGGAVTLFFSLEKRMDLEISLLDALGRELRVLVPSQSFPEGEQSVPFELHDFPAGSYFLQMKSGNRRGVLRLVRG